jgi:hypothetical protein
MINRLIASQTSGSSRHAYLHRSLMRAATHDAHKRRQPRHEETAASGWIFSTHRAAQSHVDTALVLQEVADE